MWLLDLILLILLGVLGIASWLKGRQPKIAGQLGPLEGVAGWIGLVGLSFKKDTDDLRESPFVELAERLIGKGLDLRIYDPNVSLARLVGANKEFIYRTIPHLSRQMVGSLAELAASSELVIIGHNFDGIELIRDSRHQYHLLDLTSQIRFVPIEKELGVTASA